jgi:hypothetical protein
MYLASKGIAEKLKNSAKYECPGHGISLLTFLGTSNFNGMHPVVLL